MPSCKPDDDDDDDDDDELICGMVDRRNEFSLISNRDHCKRSSTSRVSDTPRAGFEPAQNLSSGFDEGSCAKVITTTPRRQTKTSRRQLQVMHTHPALKVNDGNTRIMLTIKTRQ